MSDYNLNGKTALVTSSWRGIGQAEEISDTVRFLRSDQASFITGQTVVADGGRITLP